MRRLGWARPGISFCPPYSFRSSPMDRGFLQRIIAMGDQKQVTIGRDATGSLIITGDGNVVVIQRAITEVSSSTALGPNPYRGLLAFGEQNADRFFGRSVLIGKLWDAFRLLHESPPGETSMRCLAVLGPSGSGKSSL